MKLSLTQQIAEVKRELKMRAEVYPRQVKARAMKEAEAEYKIDSMKSVQATLEWLRDNEPLIRQRMAQ